MELHTLDRLEAGLAAPVEEHMLVCKKCRARLAGWDAYVGAMRAASLSQL
jgi:anti-sigma factor RsiW